MSDAIRLTVVEDTPISLAVGEADPVARREIAELQEDVEAIQEDVADIEEQLDGFALVDGTYPALTSGAALSLTSPTATESTWARRVTDAVDGAAVVDAILGKTVVWNQLVQPVEVTNIINGITFVRLLDGTLTANGTATSSYALISQAYNFVGGHKYAIRGCPSGGSASGYRAYIVAGSNHYDYGSGDLFTVASSVSGTYVEAFIPAGMTVTNLVFKPQLFDLTRMFGAGNEPNTVAEFEALFPEAYYPYDAGSLLNVQLEGIESTGRNLWGGMAMRDSIRSAISHAWDNENAYGRYVAFMAGNASNKRFYEGPFKENTQYTLIISAGKSNTSGNLNMRFYYTDGTYSNITRTATTNDYSPDFVANHSTANKTVAYIGSVNSSGNTYIYYDRCCLLEGYLDVSNFMPYAINQRTIPAATYFPNGMRSAGTVHDELTSDAAVTRVGAVDLGTLTWNAHAIGTGYTYYAPITGKELGVNDMTCAKYALGTTTVASLEDKTMNGITSNNRVYIRDDAYTDPAAFKAAMDGVILYYALATPTTTPISPALPMTYHVEQGGTESVMHTDPTAAPTWRIRYPFDLAGTVMANIAPVEQPVATATHAIGDLLCVGWQLYRATRAIAIGERIAAGTNVTATTVAAEIAAIQ